MHELRWTLLLLGVLFIAVLALWEQRRNRSRPGLDTRSPERAEPAAPQATMSSAEEGALHLPPLHARESAGPTELPVLEVAPDSPLAAQFESDPDGEPAMARAGSGRREPTLSDDAFGEAAQDEDLPTLGAAPEMVRVVDHTVSHWETDTSGSAGPPAVAADEPAEDETVPPEEPRVLAHGEAEREPESEPAGTYDAECDAEPSAGPGHASPTAATTAEPIVEWPPEDERQILALRIVSAGPERFAGRALRQALAGEGFLHGKFAIFHKPAGDRRACLSAASLTRPGTFDLATMDLQRFCGLSLFAVLPGPRTPADTLEELLSSARRLNERLQGALQDERGGPLTPARIAQLRESVLPEGPA